MIVVDASAMVEALVGADVDDDLLAALGGEIAAPHLLDIEVLSVGTDRRHVWGARLVVQIIRN